MRLFELQITGRGAYSRPLLRTMLAKARTVGIEDRAWCRALRARLLLDRCFGASVDGLLPRSRSPFVRAAWQLARKTSKSRRRAS